MFYTLPVAQRHPAQIWSTIMDASVLLTALPRLDRAPIAATRVPDRVDPSFLLHPGTRVYSSSGRSLGRVDSLGYDTGTGFLTSVTIQHGLFGSTRTNVGSSQIEAITTDALILRLSLADFLIMPAVRR